MQQTNTSRRKPAHRAANPLPLDEFNILIVAYIPLIRAAAYRRLPNDADKREDLVQEALLYILARREQYDPELGSIATFIRWQLKGVWGLSSNRAAARRARHERPMPVDEDGQPVVDAACFDDPAFRIDLARALETMRWLKDADLLFDLFVNGKQGSEIARARGVSDQAISQAVARARDRLARSLNRDQMTPADLVAVPHAFVLTSDVADTPQDEQDDWRPELVLLTSTSALTKFIDLLHAAGIRDPNTMPPPVAEGRRPVFAMH